MFQEWIRVGTWHFKRDDVLQQPGILGLLGQRVRPHSKLVLLQSGDPEGSGQAVSAVAHSFSSGELSYGWKLQTRI